MSALSSCMYSDTDACVCHVLSYLCDPWVGALAVDAVVLQPLVLRMGAVLLEGAAVLSFTPDTPKQRVCLQTQTAASSLGVTFVQMDCAGTMDDRRRQWHKKRRGGGEEKKR